MRFIKNFQIIREEFPFFSQFFTIHLTCRVVAIVRNPGGRHSQALVGYATLPSLCVPAARVPHAVALFTFLSLCVLVILLRFPIGCCRGLALCVFVICVCFARSPPGSLWICSLFARFCSGLAQHHIECHHKAETHHKCYGGAV